VSELLADIANLRQAWLWASAFQNARELSLGADTLFWLYESQSNCREGVPLFGETIESLRRNREAPNWEHQLALAQALSYQGFFMFRQGRHPQGREALLFSKAILEKIFADNPDEARMALSNTYAFLGTVTFVMGDFEEGDRLLHQGLMLKEELNDYWGLAFSLRQIGISAYTRGDNVRASESLERSLSISQKIGNVWSIAASLNQLGVITFSQGLFEQARKYLSDALDLSYALEDRASIAAALDGLGLVGAAQGEYDDARDLLDKSIALWDEIGEQGSFAHSLNHLGSVWKQIGNTQMARKHYLDALRVAVNAQITPVLLDSLIGEAEIQMLEGKVESALEILLAVSQSSSLPRATLDRAERLRSECESKLLGERIREIGTRVESEHLTSLAYELLSAF
jgi:tetratricopeptide (TPR) repeat protein